MWIYIKKIFSRRSFHLSLAGIVCLLLTYSGSLMAQNQELPSYTLDPVVVTASRIPQQLSKIGQSVSIITREEIEALPADSIADLLQTVSGVDVR
ncbi:MAG: TonB-dependent receptor plug domain-containing protein, partial [Desulfobacteria bacterium]